jgi:predicted ATPase
MLKRVEIKQFRSCRDVVLDNLGPVTVLAGRNAVGKTNILRAINWVASSATSLELPPSPSRAGHVSLQATIGQNTYHYTLKARTGLDVEGVPTIGLTEELISEDNNGARLPVFSRQNEEVELSPTESHIRIGASGPCMPALVSLLPADSVVVNSFRPFLSFLEGIRYYSLDEHGLVGLSPIVSQTAYDKWLAWYRSADDPGSSVLLRLLHLALTNRQQFEEIRDILGANGLGLLDDILMSALETKGTVETTVKSNDRKEWTDRFYLLTFRPSLQSPEAPEAGYFGFDGLSAGTQRVIRIIVSLIFDQSAVMLLEHPEDSIHRGLLRKLIGILQSYSDQSQLIVSSHSSVIFNTLDPGAVRLVTMENGDTKVRALTPAELSVAGKFLEEDGSLSDFLETVEEE